MRTARNLLSSLPLVLILFLLGSCGGQTVDSRVERVENGLLPPVLVQGTKGWTIEERMKEYNIPGVSIAVFHDNKIQWAKGYGVIDNDTKEPVTEKTLFVAGSISKPVAVSGALRVVQDGKMDLDKNINDYLTTWKLPENEFTAKQTVTLRLLMSHNAGVTVHGFPGYVAGTDIPTIAQILDGIPPANTAPIRVDTEPGTLWRYAGGGTTIMQLAIADVSGSPFEDVLQRSILDPVGMTSSSYGQNLTGERLAFAASGHKGDGSVIPGKRNVYPEMAAAGLWTTPTDLVLFAIEMGKAARGESNAVLGQEQARLMVTPHMDVPGGGKMALGFFLEDHEGSTYYGHGGADEGFIAGLIASRDGGYGAAIMTNSDGNSGALISEIYRSIAAEYGWEGYLPEPYVMAAVEMDVLEKYSGRYRIGSDEVLIVEAEPKNEELYGRMTDGQEFRMVAIGENMFIRQDREYTYEFTAAEGDKAASVKIIGRQEPNVGTRMSDETMVPLELLHAGRIEEAMEGYRKIRSKQADDPAVGENRLNFLGYTMMGQGSLDEAIEIFKLNVEFYPESWNVYDSLGEAFMENGQKDLAIRNYERSIRMNPENTNGKAMLEKLRKQ